MTKKRRRRGRGEGSIYKRGDGLWVASASFGYDAKGKRIRKTVYGKTKKEAREKLLEAQRDALSGLPIKPENLTLDAHFEDWLRSRDVKDTTRNNYKNVYRANIKPYMGHLKLKDIDYRKVNALYEYLEEEKELTRSVSMVAFLLRSALEDAVKKGLVPVNQAKLAASRTQQRKEARFMDQKETKKFLEAAKGERLENALILALHTGLRPGEWLGLPWDAINWKEKKLTVKQSLVEDEGRVWIELTTKTEAGRRTISLSDTASAALKRQRKCQLEEQLAYGGEWVNEHGLVFTNTNGGLLYRSSALKRLFNRVNKKAGLEGITPHTLRHTHASILIYQGVDAKTISVRLGHEDVAFTLQTYGHLFPGQDEAAAAEVDAFFDNLL